MARRRRREERGEEKQRPPGKRLRKFPVANPLTRDVKPKEDASGANTKPILRDDASSKSELDRLLDLLSDSSTLSDPPSQISAPLSPNSLPSSGKTNRKLKRPTKKALNRRKISAKEHEEALNRFVRDSTEEDQSDSLSVECDPPDDDLAADEDDEDWEDIDLSNKKEVSLDDLKDTPKTQDLVVTLERTQVSMRTKNISASAAERKIRMHAHLLHVQCLLFHGALRNNWLNDMELQNDLLLRFEKAKKLWTNYLNSPPDPEQFILHLDQTAKMFHSEFKITKRGLRKIGYRDLSMVDKEADEKFFEQFEQFQNIAEFRVAARKMEGSRDLGAQLFTALLRALGLETRLIFSLQPLGYNFGKCEDAHRLDKRKDDLNKDINNIDNSSTRPTPKKRKRKSSDTSDTEDLGLPKVRGRYTSTAKSKLTVPDSDLKFPVFWSEVSLEDKWIPVDPVVLRHDQQTPTFIAHVSGHLERFEPKGKDAEQNKQVMGYVIAYGADRFARDVTVRYVKNFAGRAKRWRVRELAVRGTDGQTVMYDWFKRALSVFTRPKETERDLKEDTELTVKPPPAKEANLDSLSYYKNHPKYVLERHLRREEALKPGSHPVRKFTSGKGVKAREEIVYSRSDVYICRAVESWYKEGKKVKEGQVPMKLVKARPMTLTRKREHEIAMAENDDRPVMEGLYAAHQVEIYHPPPVENGVIPKNGYGNIDLFVDSMLPEGAVHLPYRGIAKVAKRLEIDYAEAITGFEFKSQRAIPVVNGIVVATENEDVVIDAWRSEEVIRIEKEAARKQKEVLSRWKRFLVGLRIRERIYTEYGNKNTA